MVLQTAHDPSISRPSQLPGKEVGVFPSTAWWHVDARNVRRAVDGFYLPDSRTVPDSNSTTNGVPQISATSFKGSVEIGAFHSELQKRANKYVTWSILLEMSKSEFLCRTWNSGDREQIQQREEHPTSFVPCDSWNTLWHCLDKKCSQQSNSIPTHAISWRIIANFG